MTTPLVSRSGWGARPRTATPPAIASEGITAHYGGPSPWGAGVDRSSAARFAATADHARCASIVRAWQAYHMDHQGWHDLAYNSCVCPHGWRFEGRGVGVRSGANGTTDGNARSEAVCYIAGEGDPLTDDARRAFADEALRMEAPALRWVHSDWKPTGCPGAPIRAWRAAGWPSPTPPPAPDPDPGDDDMPQAFLCRLVIDGTTRPEVLLVGAGRDSAHWVRDAAAREGHVVLIALAGGDPAVQVFDPDSDDDNVANLAAAVLNLPMLGDMPPAYAPRWKGPRFASSP